MGDCLQRLHLCAETACTWVHPQEVNTGSIERRLYRLGELAFDMDHGPLARLNVGFWGLNVGFWGLKCWFWGLNVGFFGGLNVVFEGLNFGCWGLNVGFGA